MGNKLTLQSLQQRLQIAGLLVLLLGCGDPNVPLTRPPEDAFRVSSPRPPRTDRTSTPNPKPKGDRTDQNSLLALTAKFFRLPWDSSPGPNLSLLQATADFLGVSLPRSPLDSIASPPSVTTPQSSQPRSPKPQKPKKPKSPQPNAAPEAAATRTPAAAPSVTPSP